MNSVLESRQLKGGDMKWQRLQDTLSKRSMHQEKDIILSMKNRRMIGK